MKQFVLAHKDFESNEFDNDAIVISDHAIVTNMKSVIVQNEYDNTLFGERYAWKYIMNEIEDFAVLHHYRRKLVNMFKNHINVAHAIVMNCSLLNQLANAHSPILCEVLQKILEPGDFALLNNNIIYAYNLFCIDKPTLKLWLDFIEPKIKAAMEVMNVHNKQEAIEFVKSQPSFTYAVEGKDCRVEYQSRIFAFLLERLNTIFWMKARGPIYPCDVKLLEENQVM